MSEKLVKRAKVILKGAKSYNVGGQRFVQNIPVIVKGSMVDELKHNGYFKFTEMEPKIVEKKSDSSESEDGSKKKLKKKGSGKKVK